ncbi:MAG TPA: S16 family serine protease, partial [Spirochaetota bacterium]|nr:S16 family serine protease [Spirochaetota bacterium]
SAQISWSYIESIAPRYKKIKPKYFQNSIIHLHVPAGAIPKDGPSAGITMGLALFSLAYGKKVPKTYALTGELTVAGYILPVGGIREKIIGAKRAGKRKLIFPAENKNDFEELPSYIKKNIKVYFVKKFTEVLKITLNIE